MIGMLAGFMLWLLSPVDVEPWEEEDGMPAKKESKSAFSAGWEAASTGEPEEDNPYRWRTDAVGKLRKSEWEDGWWAWFARKDVKAKA